MQTSATEELLRKPATDTARLERGQLPVRPYARLPFAPPEGDAPRGTREVWYGGGLWMFLATGDDTAGQYVIVENIIAHGPGPAPHVHEWQDEAMYILEGDFVFEVGDQTLRVGPGALVAIPRGTVHSFHVDSAGGRALTFYTQTGFERTVLEMGTPATAATLPPPGVPPTTDPQRDAELRLRTGMVETH